MRHADLSSLMYDMPRGGTARAIPRPLASETETKKNPRGIEKIVAKIKKWGGKSRAKIGEKMGSPRAVPTPTYHLLVCTPLALSLYSYHAR